MLHACRYTIAVEDDHADSWQRIWQEARYISEEAMDAENADGRRNIWVDNAADFGALITDFQAIVRQKHLQELNSES